MPASGLLSRSFKRFFASEKAGGVLLLICTVVSLAVANSVMGESYRDLWQERFLGMSVEHWINDGLMAVFFLLIGLELKREFYNGELSHPRQALLPILAAAGGIVVPASIHFALNGGLPTQPGIGIPMATDIAFALGALALLGTRVPLSLRVFLTALAVMDDLGAIIVIAVFYSADIALPYLAGALGIFAILRVLNRLRVLHLAPYLLLGALMGFLMLRSGVHATIAGVLLAFGIPFSAMSDDAKSPSHRLEHWLHWRVAFVVLPLFALANTAMAIGGNWTSELTSPNSLGILIGLIVGKPVGIVLACAAAVAIGLCRVPADLRWSHLVGAGMLGGIGFTMSIFIANLAFAGDPATIDSSKMAILCASLVAGILGYFWLRMTPAANQPPPDLPSTSS